MSFGDFMGLTVGMGSMVAVVALFFHHLRRRLEHKERIAQIKAGETQAVISSAPERDATIEKLEHRIRVLERIATDKPANLAAQIEDLRQPIKTESLRDA
jgi:hypothetical protein